MFEKAKAGIEQLKTEGRYRPLKVWQSKSGAWMSIDDREVLQLSSNNYLGLTDHPKLKEAAKKAIDKYGVGSGSVRNIVGTMDIHEELEQKLAEFKGTEATLVFQSGFTTNLGLLSSLLGEGDVVLSDELNHASIIDGIRLSKADKKVYPHKDMNQLEALLKQCGNYKEKLIVTDGVFSMDGDIAPLTQIVDLAEKYHAKVYVDDAHASGVLGQNGKGSVDHFNLHGRVSIQVGTLSKAIGCVGGYTACSESTKEWLIHQARPFLFSTSLPPSVAASCIAALEVLHEETDRIDKLWSNATYFRQKLQACGFHTGGSETPIIPVIVGTPQQTIEFSEALLETGIFAQGIVFPTVAYNQGRIRMNVTASHTEQDLDVAVENLKQVGARFGIVK